MLNNVQVYLQAVRYLYHEVYRKYYYGSSMVVNTMGYLTGLGELLVYEIYRIVSPHRVVFMEAGRGMEGGGGNMGDNDMRD